jgi:hypothetical protein
VVVVVVKVAEASVGEASAVVEVAATGTEAAAIMVTTAATKQATHGENIANHLPLLLFVPDDAGCVPARLTRKTGQKQSSRGSGENRSQHHGSNTNFYVS